MYVLCYALDVGVCIVLYTLGVGVCGVCQV